ncbi:MAG: energy-coupled thiamine transporter ThiT [Clostridia bacterium]|nr:energy-coupled thiamine transporter ThiT [Clostridia bacterium]
MLRSIEEPAAAVKERGTRNVKVTNVQRLVESGVLLAMGVVLSIIKLLDLPYGGSVTVASMFPVMLIAYRHGPGYGLVSAAVYGAIQQLLGLKTLSFVSTWQSVIAVIMLDYVIAFAVIGFGGAFRRRFGEKQSLELCSGAFLVCILRYACHVISGATVWAGLSIPTKAALAYSFAYNATYMVPETIVMLIAAYFLGTSMNFRLPTPVRIARRNDRIPVFSILAIFAIAVTVIVDVALIFKNMQDAESGNWNINGLAEVNWLAVGIVSAVGVAIAAVLFIIDRVKAGKACKSSGQ